MTSENGCPSLERSPTCELSDLVAALTRHPAVREKASIQDSYAPAEKVDGGVRIGDDCAAIPDPTTGGHLLFAAEGMLESFVAEDPWFAGYSAVMVNLSDVAAMGGRPIAITNTLWSQRDSRYEQIWAGMQSASEAYGVPIVGGHTTQIPTGAATHLGASVVGRAGERLLTSFDAKAGDRLIVAIDMDGAYRRDKPFWNASTSSSPEKLKRNLELLPQLAEQGWCKAAKDISNGGIVGTLAMLCHCSKIGLRVDLDRMQRPAETSWLKWLTSFPSFGYVLSVPEKFEQTVIDLFTEHTITAVECGEFEAGDKIALKLGDQVERLDF